jgi:hypothetical protein
VDADSRSWLVVSPARHSLAEPGERFNLLIGIFIDGLARRAAQPDQRRDTGHMVDDTARDRAIYHALKAADEIAAALQTHLIEEHRADPERSAPHSPSTNSLKLLRQARERLGQGLRAVRADHIAESDEISLRNPQLPRRTS